jgi:hypothetical protein
MKNIFLAMSILVVANYSFAQHLPPLRETTSINLIGLFETKVADLKLVQPNNSSSKNPLIYQCNLDSAYYWAYDSLNMSWGTTIVAKTVNTYDSNNNKVLVELGNILNGQWIVSNKFIYAYDSYGNQLSEINTFYDSSAAQWINFNRILNSFDINNNLIEYSYQNWDGSSWVNYWRYLYLYDLNGNKIERITQNWDGSNWSNNQLDTYTYDSGNNMINSLSQFWDGSNWYNGGCGFLVYTYDGNGNMLTESYMCWNVTTSQWDNSFHRDCIYNTDNLMLNFVDKNWDGNSWNIVLQGTYSYDQNNNNIYALFEDWSSGSLFSYSNDFTYDLNNNCISDLSKVMDAPNNWSNHVLSLFTFDDRHNRLSWENKSWGSSGWENGVHYDYEYNIANRQISELRKIWNGIAWINADSSHFYYTINSDVWPGDANNDLQVDNYDLLPIGLYYNETGSPRTTISNAWQPEVCSNWSRFQNNGADLKHADCNGDGIVTSSDTLAINLNFTQSHAFVPSPSDLRTFASDFYITTTNSIYSPGDWVTADIWLGTQTNPVEDLYGLAFDVTYNSSFVQAGSESVGFSNSWLLNGVSNGLKIFKVDQVNSLIRVAQTRIDHLSVDGYGHIGTLQFQLKNNIVLADSIQLNIVAHSAVDALGNNLYFNIIPTSFAITVGVEEIEEEESISIYPNPFNENTQIGYELKNESKISIELFNALGQQLYVVENSVQQPGRHSVFISPKSKGYEAGIYYVKIKIDDTLITKKIIQMK